MRDSEIEQLVLRELGRHGNGNSKEISVCASDGIVTLKGSVRSRYEKSTAQKAARRAGAVTAVVNQLRVLRPESSIKASSVPIKNKVRFPINQYQQPAAARVAGTQQA
jgi:hypothetical protein